MPDASDAASEERRDTSATDSAPEHPPTTRRLGVALPVVALLSLLAIGILLALVIRNGNRAEAWQRRSWQQAVSIRELQRVLGTRSSELNFRIRQVNKLTASVRRSQTALARSESDVSSLASRQRQLADEKAQVEDERAQLSVEADALAGIAVLYQDCSAGLADLLSAVLDGDYTYVSSIAAGVGEDCRNAEDELAAYQSRYG